MADETPKLSLRDCVVRRNGHTVLRGVALDLPAGGVTALIGPNGAGKSTLLAVLQLLLTPQRGDLRLDGEPMRRDRLATRRRLAAAFQDPLLLTTSVLKNVEVGLGFRGVGRAHRRERARRWLERFGVSHLAQRYAPDISGGEAQRVSLARAFALEPEVLLLDEPFSALDAPTRAALIDDFERIVRESGITTLFVTHDRDEALRLADRVAVLIDGEIRQVGSPAAVFGAPVDEAVAAFVGVENIWPARLCTAAQGVATYDVQGRALDVATAAAAPRALFCVRPEEVTILAPGAAPAASARNVLSATVRSLTPAGPVVRVDLAVDADAPSTARGQPREPGESPGAAPPFTIVAAITRPSLEALGIAVGSPVQAAFKAAAAHVIPKADRR